MKVTLDLDALRKAGKIDQAEYDQLVSLSKEAAEVHAFNVLMTLGGIAVALGLVGLFPGFFASLVSTFVNTSAVFGSIHFYTQWFERLGAAPGSLLVGGVLALVIAQQLRAYNRSFKKVV